MKRLIIYALLLSLLLCGCGNITPPTDPVVQTQPTSEAPTQPQPTTAATVPTQTTTEATTEATTEPAPTEPELVTVYLLTKTSYFDSGGAAYYYDEDYNIDRYEVFNIENDPMFDVIFEAKDDNGMACVIRTVWAPDGDESIQNLVYFADGKLSEDQFAGSIYSGYQYAYDAAGNRTEKREYYDGILQSTVYYEYDGELLTAVYCNDREGNLVYDCRVENGLIMEKVYYDSDAPYGYLYRYDENNNLVESTFYYDGDENIDDLYFYVAVTVDAERAHYLREQQRYLLNIT